MKIYIALLFLLFSVQVSARVFDFSGESMAAFFRVNYGLNKLGTAAFAKSSGASTTFSPAPSIPSNIGGELGYVYTPSPSFSIKFGYEFYQSRKLELVDGNSGSTKLFDLTSDVFVSNPNITFEFNYGEIKTSKMVISTGVGWGNVRVDNVYAFVPGQMAGLGVAADYTEKIEENVINYFVSIGYEYLMFDNVTMFIDAGYRNFIANKLTHKAAIDIIDLTSGASTVAKGDVAKNNDGSNRGLDMGGYFVGLSFRFYIKFL